MEKLLVLSNFSFCQDVFKSRLLQIRQYVGKGFNERDIKMILLRKCFIRVKPFHKYKCILKPLQQTNFENIVAKGQITHNEQLIHSQQSFQLYSKIKLSSVTVFKVVYIDLLYVGKSRHFVFRLINNSSDIQCLCSNPLLNTFY